MYLVMIAWLYVTVMMAVAEATSPNGTLLGAVFTFLMYGAMPLSIVMYLLATPARRRAARASRAARADSPAAMDPDDGSHPPGDPVSPVRKEP